ncbi:Protocadherin Fat 4 [Echinococcus granulosus]|uniref:Protocadherin Fat 4 n=1 Tax=Echinococcus granulosus TaxID=6210 RepID=U6JFX6_ECHGR|nr:Protocadherin Fat 4 [Echinococcus granulosus]EUB61515.1 Protocadherin Fat 4 [Echinococcus granulosus]KAH9281022.1 Protocadherin Fat 4 [Echinococcus granulosus]CDS22992.1 protocadherin alpha 4 unspliced [Echinococcus granulosus]
MLLSLIILTVCTFAFCNAASTSAKSVHYVVQEECGPGTYIGNPIRDANIQSENKQPLFIKLMYSKKGDFALNETTGDLRTTRHLDREALCGRGVHPRRKLNPLPLQRADSIKTPKEIKYAKVVISTAASSQKCQVELSMVVHSGDNLLETWINVHIVVQDLNDNWPYFEEGSWNLTLSELTSVGATFQLPQAVDLDEPERSVLRYGLVDESFPSCRNHFSITCQSEIVSCDLRLVLEKPVDFEVCQHHHLILFAEDSGSTEAILPICVNIKNENEHQPRFIQSSTHLSIPRDSQPRIPLTKFHAVDKDAGKDGEITFLTNSTYFEVTDGKLLLTRSLLHYPEKKMKVFVTATDAGNPPRQSTLEVAVEITGEEAELQPGKIFIKPLGGEAISGSDAPILLPNSAEKDTLVALIWTEGGTSKVSCSMHPALSHFALENAGLLMGKPTFTLKVNKSYNFSQKFDIIRSRVEAQDVRVTCGSSQLSLHIRLAPPPGQQFRFPQKEVHLSIEESSSPIIGFYTLRPLNGVGEIYFKKDCNSPECARMHVNSRTGVLSIPHGIDREVTPELRCRFSASDSDHPANRIRVDIVITVKDINDCAPSLSQLYYSLPEFDGLMQTPILPTWIPLLKLDALDFDEGLNGSVHFELRSVKTFSNGSSNDRIPKFRLSTESGEVSIKGKDYPLLDREEISEIVLFVYLYDLGSPFRLSATYEVKLTLEDVNDNAPIFFDSESEALLRNMPWYRSTDPVPGFWTQIRIYDPDQGENGTTVLSVLEKPPVDSTDPNLRPHQVTLFKDGRLWVAEGLVKGVALQVVYLRAVDMGSRRQLHSEAKLVVDPESDQHGRNQLKRPMFVRSNSYSAGQFMQKLVRLKDTFTSAPVAMSKAHVILLIVGVSLICCILASTCVACVVLRK